ncbi:MAG: hypothetical protein ABR928_16060 [Terracidiphilus sp.]|jgi:hypothetical protein
MKGNRKLLVKDFGATGLASLILTVSMALLVPWFPIMLAMPVDGFAVKFGSWIGAVLPSQGGWVEGMADFVLAIHMIAWFEIWIVLFVFMTLIRMRISHREKRDAEDSVALHRNVS